jgi:hypothetical protein
VTTLGGVAGLLAAWVAGGACAAAVIFPRRRVVIPALFIQFTCAAVLFSSLPAALIFAYAVVGVCVCGILAVTPAGAGAADDARPAGVPSGMSFRLVAVLLVGLASVALARSLMGSSDGTSAGIADGAGLLVGLGLLQVGLSEEPLRVGAGLMAMIGGFEIGYTTVETAIALHGLIIGVPVLIALVVAYLLVLSPAGGDVAQ